MNVNQVYLIMGVAALSALISTLITYLIGSENTTVVIGSTAGSTAAVVAVIINKNKKKGQDKTE